MIRSDAASTDPAPAELDRQILALSVALWLLHFAFMVSRDFPAGMYSDAGTTLARFLTAISGIVLSHGLYLVLRRWPRRSPLGKFFQAVALGVPTCALQALLNEFAFSLFSAQYLAHPELFFNRAEYIFTFSFFFWIFVAWSAIYATLANAAELRVQERRTALAMHAATAAQLKALQLQIHPHFLFNTLNALSGLVNAGRTAEAERVIVNLAALLRHTLSAAPDQVVPLKQELELHRTYLDIERVRFGDRLQIRYAVDPACASAMMPSLLFLPLIENAVKHALARADGPVTVTVGAQRRGDELMLWVDDERSGERAADAPQGLGIGLANARERLQMLYGGRATLEAEPTAHGWVSRVMIPWTTLQ